MDSTSGTVQRVATKEAILAPAGVVSGVEEIGNGCRPTVNSVMGWWLFLKSRYSFFHRRR